jgi:hypothetical protein
VAHYALANKNISGEIIDDELIIIDLARGIYFTSKGAALPLWRAIIAEAEVDGLVAQLAAQTDDVASFKHATESWLNALTDQGILREEAGSGRPLPTDLINGENRSQTVAPTFEMHQDLEDILLFDPVHDFEELGWPKQPKA